MINSVSTLTRSKTFFREPIRRLVISTCINHMYFVSMMKCVPSAFEHVVLKMFMFSVCTFISVHCSFQYGSRWYLETYNKITSFHVIFHKGIPETPTHFFTKQKNYIGKKCLFLRSVFLLHYTGYVSIFGVSQKDSSYLGENISFSLPENPFSRSNFFHFHAVLGKKLPNNGLAMGVGNAIWEILDLPLYMTKILKGISSKPDCHHIEEESVSKISHF